MSATQSMQAPHGSTAGFPFLLVFCSILQSFGLVKDVEGSLQLQEGRTRMYTQHQLLNY